MGQFDKNSVSSDSGRIIGDSSERGVRIVKRQLLWERDFGNSYDNLLNLTPFKILI